TRGLGAELRHRDHQRQRRADRVRQPDHGGPGQRRLRWAVLARTAVVHRRHRLPPRPRRCGRPDVGAGPVDGLHRPARRARSRLHGGVRGRSGDPRRPDPVVRPVGDVRLPVPGSLLPDRGAGRARRGARPAVRGGGRRRRPGRGWRGEARRRRPGHPDRPGQPGPTRNPGGEPGEGRSMSAFPGGTAMSRVRVYDWPTTDGAWGGSPHLHTASTEGYVVLAGHGSLETLSGAGYGEHTLAPGTVLWFTPGTVHRLVNTGGDLELLVVM